MRCAASWCASRKPFGFLNHNRRQSGARPACRRLRHGRRGAHDPRAPGGRLERPDALDTGSVTMTGLGPQAVVRRIRVAMDRERIPRQPADYQIENTPNLVEAP